MARERYPEREPVQEPEPEKEFRRERDPEKESMQARISELETRLVEVVQASAGITYDDSYEKWKEWCGLSAQEKTQLACDKQYGTDVPKRFRVILKDHPEVIIPANSREEAIGRYNQLCGILRTEHEYSVTPVEPAIAKV